MAIVGPTATGKSRLAIRLAQAFSGEIINADSRQVYRHLDIGTAKPNPQEMSLVPHHLVDIIDPDEDFSLAQYQALAFQAIKDTQERNRLPWLVGGSGLYVRAVLEGWQIPEVPPDPELRRRLEERAGEGNAAELYQELVRIDPVAAEKIDSRNVRRVIRALEVNRTAGTHFSRLPQKQLPPFDTLIIGLTADRAELYRRIDSRVDEMVAQGLVEEVKKLLDMGYDLSLPSMSGVGYRQIGRYLKGELTLEMAIQQTKYETHRIARHQYSWFRLKDDRIKWFDIAGEIEHKVEALVAGFIGG